MRIIVTFLALISTTFAQQPQLIWEDQFDLSGRVDQARSVVLTNDKAVALGAGAISSNELDLILRVYDNTGALAWSASAPLSGGFLTNVFVSQMCNMIFAIGMAPDMTVGGSGGDFLVKA